MDSKQDWNVAVLLESARAGYEAARTAPPPPPYQRRWRAATIFFWKYVLSGLALSGILLAWFWPLQLHLPPRQSGSSRQDHHHHLFDSFAEFRKVEQLDSARDVCNASATYTELQRNMSSLSRTLAPECAQTGCQLPSHARLAGLADAVEANSTALAAAARHFHGSVRTSMDMAQLQTDATLSRHRALLAESRGVAEAADREQAAAARALIEPLAAWAGEAIGALREEWEERLVKPTEALEGLLIEMQKVGKADALAVEASRQEAMRALRGWLGSYNWYARRRRDVAVGRLALLDDVVTAVVSGRQRVEVLLAAVRQYHEDVGMVGETAAAVRRQVGGKIDGETGIALLAKSFFRLKLSG